jgi:hypothetical protein
MSTIKSFFNPELLNISFDQESLNDWTKLVIDMGLVKQLNLRDGKGSPIPYPYMNTTMQRVYSTLCPVSVELQEYNKTPIPLEILREISFTLREKQFTRIEIWYDDKTTDPIVVGCIGKWGFLSDIRDSNNEKVIFPTKQEAVDFGERHGGLIPYFYGTEKYLIAKWGEEDKPFEELRALAMERFVSDHKAKMQAEIKTLQSKYEMLEENAHLYLNGTISLSQATSISNW